MNLSTIIVTYNSARFIGPCLRSLRSACVSLQTELIVVDNGSADDTLALVLAEWPGATIVRNACNRGFAAANNQGAKVSRGDYLLLLNADTLLLDQNLPAALEYAESQLAAILGPKMVGSDGVLQRTWDTRNSIGSYLSDIFSLATFSRRFRPSHPAVPTTPVPVRFLVGAALLVSRAAYTRHGLFDERFFFSCEERDLCYRYACASELLVYFPGWSVLHYGGGGETLSPWRLDHWISSSFLFADKHGGARHRLLARLAFLLLLLSYAAAFLLKAAARHNRQYLHLAKIYAQAIFRLPKLSVIPEKQEAVEN